MTQRIVTFVFGACIAVCGIASTASSLGWWAFIPAVPSFVVSVALMTYALR